MKLLAPDTHERLVVEEVTALWSNRSFGIMFPGKTERVADAPVPAVLCGS